MSESRQILSLHQQDNIPLPVRYSLVRDSAFHWVEWERDEEGTDGLVIFVSQYAFRDLKDWRETDLGERMLRLLHDPQYDQLIKCIYFDPIMRREPGEEEDSDILHWTAQAVEVAFKENDKEDIILFIFCMECCTLCTMQKRVTCLPMFNPERRECQGCLQQGRGYF